MWLKSTLGLVAAAAMLAAPLALASTSRATDLAAGDSSVFLVARPDMPDPLFAQTVILMLPDTDHDFPLVVGLMVNKPISEMLLRNLFPGSAALKDRSDTAFFGGPIDIETPAIVFSSDHAIDNATRLADGVYVSLDPALAATLAQDPKRLRDFRLILGRSQWTSDQLHSEMMRGAWYMVRAETGVIFSSSPGSLWDTLAARARLIPAAAFAAPRASACLPAIPNEGALDFFRSRLNANQDRGRLCDFTAIP